MILAIDQGTTGSKALLVDAKLKVIAEKIVPFKQHYPQPGWVEHDLDEIWKSVLSAIRHVASLAGAGRAKKRIQAIGITNQRETICFWDRKTTEALAPAIVWQDRRTAEECTRLKGIGAEPKVREATGLVLDPYFSATKAAWALKHWPKLVQADRAGRLAIGTIDSFLVARLSGGVAHVTEPSNASRTSCFHLEQHRWDESLCSLFGVHRNLWPEVRPSVGEFARTQGVRGVPNGTPITGILGDQQAALLGQACLEPGMAKITYGTGSFILLNTGDRPVRSGHHLLTTIAWALDSKRYTYAIEGSAFIAGAAVQWVRDGLGIIKKSSEIEKLARSVPDSGGVVFVPALTGLGAPYWDPHATGLLTGLTRGTTRGHLARATLEGIAFQNTAILRAMEKDLGAPLKELRVDGGASANDLLMQIQADLLDLKLLRPKIQETTALGAIFAAGLGAGIWSDIEDVRKAWKLQKTFEPEISPADRNRRMQTWARAVGRAMFNG